MAITRAEVIADFNRLQINPQVDGAHERSVPGAPELRGVVDGPVEALDA